MSRFLTSSSPLMNEAISELRLYAPTDLPLLVEGESGTGKELFVTALHALSRHAGGPIISMNMGEGPDTLFESSLFGHRKGSFTGAEHDRLGLIGLAKGGTLFFDEMNSLPLSLQPKLLRVLETRSYRPVGGIRPEETDARFVFSSNESLKGLAGASRFRSDLLYRMGHQIRLPPLRERSEDIANLSIWLLESAGKAISGTRASDRDRPEQSSRQRADGKPTVSPGAMARLRGYSWPGNIRQLKRVLERALLLSKGREILPEHLDLPYEESTVKNFGEAMEGFEEIYFSQIFGMAGSSIRMGLKLTGMSETSYRRKIRKYSRRISGKGVRVPQEE